jgi:hypothetical protein
MDEDSSAFNRYIRGLDPSVRYVMPDDHYHVSRAYHVDGVPLHVLIDEQGILLENPSIGPMIDFNLFLLRVIKRD